MFSILFSFYLICFISFAAYESRRLVGNECDCISKLICIINEINISENLEYLKHSKLLNGFEFAFNDIRYFDYFVIFYCLLHFNLSFHYFPLERLKITQNLEFLINEKPSQESMNLATENDQELF